MHDDFLENPYLFLPKVVNGDFYVGGLSAAFLWNLSSDIPTDVTVITKGDAVVKEQKDLKIDVYKAEAHSFFGTEEYQDSVFISDIDKTALDTFLYPKAFGGKQMADDVFRAYLDHPDANIKKLYSYAKKINQPELMSEILKVTR